MSNTEKAEGDKVQFEKYVTVRGISRSHQGGAESRPKKDASGELVWRAAGVKGKPLVIEIAKRIDGRKVTVTKITVP